MRDEMRRPAKIVSEILTELASHVRPGVSTFMLDCIAEREIKKHGVFSYIKGYHPAWARTPYPAYTCISVTPVFAHGIPRKTLIKEGQMVIIDLGIVDRDGNCADAALTVIAGESIQKNKDLLKAAKKTTMAGIEKIRDGARVNWLAMAMKAEADKSGFVINHQLASHFIGKEMHENPIIYNVPNHYDNRSRERYLEYEEMMNHELKEGKVVCLEPILTFKDRWGFVNPETGWEFMTSDRQASAMFEHMVLIKKDGYEILTNHF